MFSNFRNVMENLAQPQPRPSHPGRSESQEISPNSEQPERQHSRGSASFDLTGVAHSTGHLAESAFSNLRKSLAAQRPFTVVSPTSDSSRMSNSSPQPDRELKPVLKPALEDRLRASFAIGDVSGSSTPSLSHAPSPRPQLPVAIDGIVSPKSTPLPDSAPTSPLPIDLTSPSQSNAKLPETLIEGHPLSAFSDESPLERSQSHSLKDKGFRIPISPSRSRYPEADIPLPPFSPTPTNLAASQSSQISASPVQESPLQSNGSSKDPEDLARLGLLEAQLSEMSAEFERLMAIRDAMNTVLTELTPVNDISDVKALVDHLQNVKSQQNSSQEEIKRLNSRLSTYDERIEELRDTHRLESRSQTELVYSLRKQLEESEALLKAAQSSAVQTEEDVRARQAEIEQARSEAQKLKETVKEEEEKRVKAISLLKTVRQKLVKAEKDRDEAVKEVTTLKEKEKASMERDKSERARLENEIEAIRAEKERDVAGLKSHFDRELIGMRERLEKEFAARKGQLEVEAASTKTSFQKDIAAKNAKIQTLENSVRSLSSERDSLFDQLQMRQAELESSQSMLESLQSSTSELQFQLREVSDRSSLLAEELSDAQRQLEYRSQPPSLSEDDTARIRAATEAKYEARISELAMRLADVERDRNETEAALSRNLQQKTEENEKLRKTIDMSSQRKGAGEKEMLKLRQEIEALQKEASAYKEQLSDLERLRDRVNDLQAQLQKQTADFTARSEQYEQDITEAKERELQVRASNKSVREELRKVQSSAALLERQRNPGVGYWSRQQDNRSEAAFSSPTPSTSDLPSLSRVGSPAPTASDEEVNLEYLRNVILQFLEHKDMRPHLVRVLSIILRFTPQETRRLMAKV